MYEFQKSVSERGKSRPINPPPPAAAPESRAAGAAEVVGAAAALDVVEPC